MEAVLVSTSVLAEASKTMSVSFFSKILIHSASQIISNLVSATGFMSS